MSLEVWKQAIESQPDLPAQVWPNCCQTSPEEQSALPQLCFSSMLAHECKRDNKNSKRRQFIDGDKKAMHALIQFRPHRR